MDKPTALQRCLLYPDVPPDKCAADRVRIAAHFDIDILTVIHQERPSNGVCCLQAILPNATEWINVEPVDGTLVVQIGKVLNFWSGGRITSTKHRVRRERSDFIIFIIYYYYYYFHIANSKNLFFIFKGIVPYIPDVIY